MRGIGVASFFADVGHEVPTAMLPELLTRTLGGSAAVLGIIEGASDGLAGATRFVGGALTDDPERRRRTAVGGCAITAVPSALIGVAGSTAQVAVRRVGGPRPARPRAQRSPGRRRRAERLRACLRI